MAFQKVVDTAEIVIEFNGNTKTVKNVLHAEKPGGYNLADLTALAVAVDANVAAAWLAEMTNQINYVQTTVRGLALENDQEVIVATSAAAGGRVSEANPGNVTFAVKKTSGLTGRSARGRLYWCGLSRDQLDINENLVDSVQAAAIVSNIGSMRGTINGTVWTPVIVSRFSAGVKRSEGKTFTWTGEASVDLEVDSQRRRLL